MKYPAWNNGDLLRPNTENGGVQKLIAGLKAGINANELCWREIECTGYPGSFPITAEQLESAAYRIARDAIRTGLPINRNTVLTHADLNSVNRSNCAFTPAQREKQMTKLIDRARAIKAEIKQGDPEPPEEPPPPVDPCQEAKDALQAAEDRNDELAAALEERDARIAAGITALTPLEGAPV